VRIYPLGQQARDVMAHIEAADRAIEDADGIITDEVEALLSEVDAMVADIAADADPDELARVVLELKAVEAGRKAEAKRARLAAARASRYVEQTRAAVLDVLKAQGVTKLKGTNHALGIRKAGGLAPLEVDADAVPPEFLKPGEPDQRLIRDALSAGFHTIDFARLLPRGSYLSVK
jgi:hypothetical protein